MFKKIFKKKEGTGGGGAIGWKGKKGKRECFKNKKKKFEICSYLQILLDPFFLLTKSVHPSARRRNRDI